MFVKSCSRILFMGDSKTGCCFSGFSVSGVRGFLPKNYRIFFFLFSDKIATGSFDKTCKLWSTETGKCFYTFRGHTAEIVSSDGCFLFLCFPTPSLMTMSSSSLWAPTGRHSNCGTSIIHPGLVNISTLQGKIVWQFLR